jgi:tetratricopeptide (TPR) repeat protein
VISFRLNGIAAAIACAAAIVLPGPLAAQQTAENTHAANPLPEPAAKPTISGSYLAARHASVERDAESAAAFYRAALKLDPKNTELRDRAFISLVAEGNFDEAVKLAERIVAVDKTNRIARLVIGVRALKQKQYVLAQQNINQSVRGPITDLIAALLSSWAIYGAGDVRGAVAAIDKLNGAEWYPIFKDLHAGLIYDLANRPKDAAARLEKTYKLDDSALRVADAYGRVLSRTQGAEAATAIYQAFDKKLARHPLVQEQLRELKAGKKLPPLVDSPQTGAAEALYGVGASLTRKGGEDLALIYLQLALYLHPTHAMALLSLGDLYETVKKPQLAIKAYERVPANSPLHRNAQIQLATNLDAVDRSEEAIKELKATVAENDKDSRRSWRSAISSARARSSATARIPIPRASTRCRLSIRTTGCSIISAASASSVRSSGRNRRSRSQEGAGASARSAARAELSRLFVDRSGRQSRRGHEDDPPRGRSAPG